MKKILVPNKKMSINFTDLVNQKISETEESVINICIHSDDVEMLREFSVSFSTNPKIKWIYIEGIDERDIKSFSNRKIKNYETISRDNSKAIVFVDFKGGFNVLGLNNDFLMNYTRKIEKTRYYRDKCIAVFLYRYIGEPLRSGYWKYQYNISDELQYLTLSRWGKIVQQIPEPVQLRSIRDRVSREEHLNGLKDFFIKFITLLMEEDETSNPEMASRVLEICNRQDSIAELVVAFTHMSVSYLNYDIYEYIGDRISNCSMAVAMVSKYPNMDKRTASTYANYYNSAEGQEIFSEDLKLFERMIKPNFINPSEKNPEKFKIKTKAKSDIYESFIGCISRIMDRNFYPGSQFGICFKMVSYIVDTFSFDREILRGNYKTQVLQLLEMYSKDLKGSIDLNLDQNNSSGKLAQFTVRDTLLRFLNAINDEVGRQISTLKLTYNPLEVSSSEVEEEMWRRAFEFLLRSGLSYEKVRKTINSDLKNIMDKDKELSIRFKEKLLSEYEGYSIEELLSRINFEINVDQNYVSMSLIPYNFNNNGSYYNSFVVPIIRGQREEDIYEIYDIILENSKLSCVMMPREVNKDYNFANAKIYGIYLAIKEYVENGTMVEK